MNLDKYQKQAAEFDLFETTADLSAPGFLEKVLGLVGEAGEAADKVKKILRDKGGRASEEDKAEIVKELGDVLWYVANVARSLGVSLSEVAEGNIEKLSSRKKRGKISGSGDNR
ncbi:MAG: nucleoside triphosphate pyrophosphohydrolase family protein [Candidatus Saccharibacteria bacterium]|nr:nucleoside triphosphate pyrophosphohydrolase family protein [Candidatus Saccharibacteria bacterium]